MAAVTKPVGPQWRNDSRYVVKWTLTDADPTGDWLECSIGADKSVHVVFNAGTGTVLIQGSNESGTPANPQNLRNENRDVLSFTASGLELVLPNTLKIRAVVSGGAGNDIDVYLNVNGS